MRIALLAFLVPTTLAAQTLVSTTPQNRTGILEEFTAINCPICPQGHTIATNLLAANPGNFIVIGVHGGSLANPSAGQLDFRTSWSSNLWSHFGVNAQPLGLMNRTPVNGQLVLGRSVWSSALNTTLATPSPVNIGVATQFDASTRDLTVDVELYYTADGTGGDDQVHVLLTESNMIGYQASGGANYSHQHVLRSYITPLWGDAVPNNTMGSLDQRSYTFNVPLGWDINNCHVVAFVGEYQGQVHDAVEIGANGLSTGANDIPEQGSLSVYPQPASDLLFVSVDGADPSSAFELRDMQGRSVARTSTSVSNGMAMIDVSGLGSGTYVLIAGSSTQRILVAR